MNIQIFPESSALLSYWGFTGSFWEVNLITLRDTWIGMLALLGVILLVKVYLKKGMNLVSFSAIQVVSFFETMSIEAFGRFRYDYFLFISALFFFTFTCNLIGLLPFVEEPTRDLNTTLVVGLISFLYIQLQKIRVHGIGEFCKEYLVIFDMKNRFLAIALSAIASVLLFPLTVIGEVAKVISMSFRLFGNILGGSILFMIALWGVQSIQQYFVIYVLAALFISWVLLKVIDPKRHVKTYYVLFLAVSLALSLTLAQLFFGVFEGLIQAYVVTTLTATYLAIGTNNEDEHHAQEQQ